jgi:ABC-2 type transport system permease protein
MEKYFKIFTLSIAHSLKNYKALIGLSIFLVTCLIIFDHIWRFAAFKMGTLHLQPEQLLWYIAFNEWMIITLPDVQEDMEQDLRSGRLAYLLPRPISYLGAIFCEGLGLLLTNLVVLGMVTFLFTWWTLGTMTFHFPAFIAMVGLGLLAGCVALIFHMLIGLSAFWMQNVAPFQWIWEKLLFTLGGLMLPLALYPEWMQRVAAFTPFPAILGQRSALAIDFSLNDVWQVTLTLLLWGILGIAALLLVYRRGLRIVNVEGG